MAINYRFVVRRGNSADWTAQNPVILQGEFGLELDTGKLKMGDGATAWNSLDYIIGDTITQTITNGDTTHAPSGDAVFDALAAKANTSAVWNTGINGTAVPTIGGDLNDATGSHSLYAAGSSNRPVAGNGFVWGTTQTLGGAEYGIQEWGRVNRRFFRSLEAGAWSSWREYVTTSGAEFTGAVSVSGSNFYADPVNPRIGVGTSAPQFGIHVSGPSAGIRISRIHGTQDGFLQILNNDDIATGGQVRGLPTGGLRFTDGGAVNTMLRLIIGAIYPGTDNTYSSGTSAARWSVVYAATGSINTSDAREKDNIRELTPVEIACAVDLAAAGRIYQWKAALAEKGDEARLHCSPTVQSVIEIMEAHGLDPFRYGFVCFDEWDEQPEIRDEETGEVTQEHRPAGNRYSLRPSELESFIAAGMAAKVASLEARLAALEVA